MLVLKLFPLLRSHQNLEVEEDFGFTALDLHHRVPATLAAATSSHLLVRPLAVLSILVRREVGELFIERLFGIRLDDNRLDWLDWVDGIDGIDWVNRLRVRHDRSDRCATAGRGNRHVHSDFGGVAVFDVNGTIFAPDND